MSDPVVISLMDRVHHLEKTVYLLKEQLHHFIEQLTIEVDSAAQEQQLQEKVVERPDVAVSPYQQDLNPIPQQLDLFSSEQQQQDVLNQVVEPKLEIEEEEEETVVFEREGSIINFGDFFGKKNRGEE